MKHELVVEQLMERLQINDAAPEYQTLKDSALRILEYQCNERDIDELPDREVSNFLKKTKISDLYIEDAKQKMRLARLSNPDLYLLPAGEGRKLDSAIENLSNYLERIAVLLYADKQESIQESDFPRLGIEDVSTFKKVIEICPLIEKKGDHYSLKPNELIPHLYIQRLAKDEMQENSGLIRGNDGKVYFPVPARKPYPWEGPPIQQEQGYPKTDLRAPSASVAPISDSALVAPVNPLCQPANNDQSKIIPPQMFIKATLNELHISPNTLNDAQINKINGTIMQLEKEVRGSRFFNLNKNRKEKKITALKQLLEDCRKGVPIEEAVNKARKSPGVIEGRLSKRTAQLLEELAPSEASPLIKKP